MKTMRVAQIPNPKRPFEIAERPIPQPAPGTVRIKVAACGICHSDSLVKEGLWPGIQYPRVPGHEVAGTIDAIGEGVVAARMKVKLPPDMATDSEVDLCTGTDGYSLRARLNVSLPGLDRQVAQSILDGTHQTCPYSKATRGNIDVAINLVDAGTAA